MSEEELDILTNNFLERREYATISSKDLDE